ncbi:MAG: hypothetical protein M3R61_02610, partial [Chloroflexota bacterium]|nr:hypothetical protein [Chloroflexota bacterium]
WPTHLPERMQWYAKPSPADKACRPPTSKECVDDRIIVNLRYAPDCIAHANHAAAAEKAYQNNQGDATSFDSTG